MAATTAGGAPLTTPAPPAKRPYNEDRLAASVTELLTQALARDDERNRVRCPRCGRRWHNENHS